MEFLISNTVPSDLDWLDNEGNIEPARIADLKALKKAKDELDDMEKKWRESLLNVMEKYNIKGYDGEGLQIRYKEPSEREKFDKKAFLDDSDRQALYDQFVTYTPVKASVTVTVKE